MAYASPSTLPTGTLVTSTMWAQLVNNDKFFHAPPNVRVTRLASQTVTVSAYTAIAWSSKNWDNNSMFASTGTKLTCKTAGKFLVTANVIMQSSTTGTVRNIGIRKNSTGTGNPDQGTAGEKVNTATARAASLCISNLVSLTTGQFIEIAVFSDGSSNGLKTSTGVGSPYCSMLWVSS